MTDPTVTPPPSRWDARLCAFVGETARPFAMYAIAAATAAAIIAPHVDAGKLTAAGLILGALYTAKTVENQQAGKHAAQVEIARAAGGAP